MTSRNASPTTLRFSSALLVAVLVASPDASRAQGVAERAGQALDDVGRGIRDGVQGAFARTRASVDNQEVIGRVYGRLHWDKVLFATPIELEVQGGGTVILRGAVADEAARRRAVALVRDTVGVAQVVDELAVAPAPRAIPVVPGPAAVKETTTTTTTTVVKP
jgi:hypothetical protein